MAFADEVYDLKVKLSDEVKLSKNGSFSLYHVLFKRSIDQAFYCSCNLLLYCMVWSGWFILTFPMEIPSLGAV